MNNNDYIEVNGKFYIHSKVVMLPSEKASPLVLHKNGVLYPFRENKTHLYDSDCIYQNLYFLSNEEIKELP